MLETAHNSQKVMKKKKIKINKKKMVRAIVILVLLAYLIHTGFVYFTVKRYNNIIYPGVKIEDIKLGNKNKEEALNTLRKRYEKDILKKNIVISLGSDKYTVNYAKLNMNYDIENTVNDALKYGKDKDVHERYRLIKKKEEKNFNLKYSYDKKALEEIIGKIEDKVNKKAIDAKIIKDKNGTFKILDEKEGQALDREKLIKDINEKVGNKDVKDIAVSANINKVNPKRKKEDLKKIDKKVSTFSTNFASSSESRANNIIVAAKALDATVVMPGEAFSFNSIVGERTESNGYQAAPVIVGDKLESGLGGGICQVSTTLHNAILRANINPTLRQHHTLPVAYVPLGMDATVDYGSIDYKFKNTLNYPIYIESNIKDKNMEFNIYSNGSLTKRNYDIVNSVETKKMDGKYCNVAKVYRITYENGKQISKIQINEDHHNK